MTATVVTTSTGSIVLDYSTYLDVFDGYFSRIATALETIATASTSTSTPIVLALNSIANASTITAASSVVTSNATSSSTTIDVLQQLLTTASFIGSMLESIAAVNATTAAGTTGVAPTFQYAGNDTTSTSAIFTATVGGTTGTTLFVSNITTGTILINMAVTGTYITTPNYIIQQTSGSTGGTGTYELLYNTGYNIHLNRGNSPAFAATGVYTTSTTLYITSTNVLTALQTL